MLLGKGRKAMMSNWGMSMVHENWRVVAFTFTQIKLYL